jgi:tetratricopeptide (TPR) repeat protein
MSDFHPTPAGAYDRGCLLRSQRRTDDAINAFQQVLQYAPDHAASLSMLALCWTEKESYSSQAVEAAERAVVTEPEDAFARAVFAITLDNAAQSGQKKKIQHALSVAQKATGLDPDLDLAHAVQAAIHLRLEQRAEAEVAARKALAINPENSMAGEVLSCALLLQSKGADNEELIGAQLRRNPDDDSTHSSAGWQALTTGNHNQANIHFAEALRLNPMNERARLGLIESLRARSAPYRLQIKFASCMNQFTTGKQTAILIGGFIFYKIAYNSVSTVSPILGNVIICLWLVFALWSHLARGLSTFFIVLDRFARRALRPVERWEGLAVGGCLLLALLAVISSLWIDPSHAGNLALIYLFAGICNAAAFTNEHHRGKFAYFGVAALSTFAALYYSISLALPAGLPGAIPVFSLGLFGGVAVSWLRGFGVGYR